MNKLKQTGWGLPALASAPLPKPWWFVVVEGRNRRPERFPTQAAAERLARDLCRYEVKRTVVVMKAEPVTAMRDV